MDWLSIIASTNLYGDSVGASRDERIQIASDHYIGQMKKFYDGLKNVSSEDLDRISQRKNVDEHLLLGSVAPHPLLEEANEGRHAEQAGWDRDQGRRYTLGVKWGGGANNWINNDIDTMLGAMRGSPSSVESLKQKIPNAIWGDHNTDGPPKEFHQRVTNSVNEVTNNHIPDILERHGNIPIFGVNRLRSDDKDLLAIHHPDRGITPFHPIGGQDSSELHQEGSPHTSMTYHDVIRHEMGHHVAHSLVRQEFLNGTSQHPDSIWNRVYKGAMGQGSTPLMPQEHARPTTPDHINHNLYLRNLMEVGGSNFSKKPISGYSVTNPEEWFAEAFNVVTHPDYKKIRKGFKTQSNIDALDYVAGKIGR